MSLGLHSSNLQATCVHLRIVLYKKNFLIRKMHRRILWNLVYVIGIEFKTVTHISCFVKVCTGLCKRTRFWKTNVTVKKIRGFSEPVQFTSTTWSPFLDFNVDQLLLFLLPFENSVTSNKETVQHEKDICEREELFNFRSPLQQKSYRWIIPNHPRQPSKTISILEFFCNQEKSNCWLLVQTSCDALHCNYYNCNCCFINLRYQFTVFTIVHLIKRAGKFTGNDRI